MSMNSTLWLLRPIGEVSVASPVVAELASAAIEYLRLSPGREPLMLRATFGPRVPCRSGEDLSERGPEIVPVMPAKSDWRARPRKRLAPSLSKFSKLNRPVSTAFLTLGNMTPDIYQQVENPEPAGDKYQFLPYRVDLHVGALPVGSSLGLPEDYYEVTGIGFDISGHGTIFPWTPQDAFRILSEAKPFAALKVACEALLPSDDGADWLAAEDYSDSIEGGRGWMWAHFVC